MREYFKHMISGEPKIQQAKVSTIFKKNQNNKPKPNKHQAQNKKSF